MDNLEKKQETQDLSFMQQGEGYTGFENTYEESFKIPFLKVLNDLSPEIKASSASRIEGAQVGMMCNSATGELYSSVDVIVLKVDHVLTVWKPNRGGFMGRFPKTDEEKIVARSVGPRKYTKEDNEVNDTMEFLCVNANNPSDMFVITMSVSSFKYGRNFATNLRMLSNNGSPVGVCYAGVWTIKTVLDRNDQNEWYTIGNTPRFKRFITPDEFNGIVKPAIERSKDSEVDYNQFNDMQTQEEGESVEY